jgi:hypothetical protein
LNLHPEIYPDTRHKENDHGLQTSSFAFRSILLVSNWNSAASAAAWDIHLQTPPQVCPFFWRSEGYQMWHDMLGYVIIRFIRAGEVKFQPMQSLQLTCYFCKRLGWLTDPDRPIWGFTPLWLLASLSPATVGAISVLVRLSL